MVRFIGEDGYYPSWTKGTGRWVQQRVFTTVGQGFLSQLDSLARPTIADEILLWAPPKGGLRGLRSIFDRAGEAARALNEVQYLLLSCSRCDWSGCHPHLEVPVRQRPSSWRIRCPKCQSIAWPDIDNLNIKTILKQWISKGKPKLEQPGAARSIKSIEHIRDLEEWVKSFEPMEHELSYVGQQLWPNLVLFLQDVKQPNYERNT